MLIHAGKKTVRVRRGHVVEVCPICLDFRSCALRDVRSKVHLYRIGIGSGITQFFELECSHCRVLFPKAGQTPYRPVPRPIEPNEQRVQATNPLAYEQFSNLDALHKAVSDGVLDAQAREVLIDQAITAVSYGTQVRAARGVDENVAQAFVVLGLIGAVAAAITFENPSTRKWGWPSLALMLIGFGGAAAKAIVGPRFTINHSTLPTLARALAPIRPTDAELNVALAKLKADGDPLGKWLSVADINRAIETLRAAT